MKPLFTMTKDAMPPKDNLLAVLCFGFDVKAANFDGYNFYDKETGGQLAVGSVKAWVDVSTTKDIDRPLMFANIQFYANLLKFISDSLSDAK